MQIDVNGTRLWFDVDGPGLVPDATEMRERPTLLLIHGGPGVYDHAYFKPDFGRLAESVQVVYLDLRGHGRSEWTEPATWTLEACADDIRAFCDALGIDKPVVYGHSMGAPIVLLYGARNPGHASGLIVHGGFARFEIPRLVEGFRRVGGDEVAHIAERRYRGEDVQPEEWARVYAAFGPNRPTDEESARWPKNLELNPVGMERIRELDFVDELGEIEVPTLVLVGALDPVTPLAASEEIVEALGTDLGQLRVLEGAGHFSWLDTPEPFFRSIQEFVESTAGVATERDRAAAR
jgi:pimeloyl-ACP methyl ester carboxylesterase